jgi:RHS repeat-associated protein
LDRLHDRTLPNGVTTTYGYDARDRVLSVVHRAPLGNVLASVVYERSESGEPTKITREDGSYMVLTYDAALRLDTETYYNADAQVLDAIDYDYDPDGNRTAKTSLSNGFESYDYEAGFKLATVTGSSGSENYDYDGGGRLTSVDRSGVARTLEYNSDDKLTRVLNGGSEVASYTYDGVGRRVAANDGAGTRRYLVAPNVGDGFETPQAVTDASGTLLTSYVFAGEHPIARIGAGGQVEYYLQDAMGSVIGMADGSGASTASIKYDAFGNVTSTNGSAAAIPNGVGTDFRYHGMQLDAATGLYHVRARTYDARTGRFTSRDPVDALPMLPETYHPYVLANSNPQQWRDPTGLFTLMEVTIASAIVGILASTAVTSSGYSFLQRLRGEKFLQGAESFPKGLGYATRHGLRLHGFYGECEARRAELATDITLAAFRWAARLVAENPQEALEFIKEIVRRNPEAVLGLPGGAGRNYGGTRDSRRWPRRTRHHAVCKRFVVLRHGDSLRLSRRGGSPRATGGRARR